jgi:hypothetical protein
MFGSMAAHDMVESTFRKVALAPSDFSGTTERQVESGLAIRDHLAVVGLCPLGLLGGRKLTLHLPLCVLG